jgi:hypothetical protein
MATFHRYAVILAIVCLTTAGAAEDVDPPGPPPPDPIFLIDPADQADPPPPAAPDFARIPDLPDGGRIGSSAVLASLRDWCTAQRLDFAVAGAGQFRLGGAGPVTIDRIEHLVELGNQALANLETWTGAPRVFIPPVVTDDGANVLVVIADRHFDTFIDHARATGVLSAPEGDADLVRSCRVFSVLRLTVICESIFELDARLPQHWAVNSSAALALTAFFWERGTKPPEPWLGEGIANELERLLCTDKTPRIMSISYEENRPRPTGNWAQAVAKLVTASDPELRTAEALMELDLIGRSGKDYQQFWSFSTFIRLGCGAPKPGDSRFYTLLTRIAAADGNGPMAIKEILGKEDPDLTRFWHQWAARQR